MGPHCHNRGQLRTVTRQVSNGQIESNMCYWSIKMESGSLGGYGREMIVSLKHVESIFPSQTLPESIWAEPRPPTPNTPTHRLSHVLFSLKYTRWPETHPNQGLSHCLPNRLTVFSQAGPVAEQGWGRLPPLKAKCGINQTEPCPLPLWPTDRRLIWASTEGVEGKVSQLIHQSVRRKAGIGDGINGRQTEST